MINLIAERFAIENDLDIEEVKDFFKGVDLEEEK